VKERPGTVGDCATANDSNTEEPVKFALPSILVLQNLIISGSVVSSPHICTLVPRVKNASIVKIEKNFILRAIRLPAIVLATK
jgi:hypothetical protein